MKLMLKGFLGVIVLALVALGANYLGLLDLNMLSFAPVFLGGLLILVRLLDDGSPAPSPPLKVMLLGNVVTRLDSKPPLAIEVKKIYSRRWDSK